MVVVLYGISFIAAMEMARNGERLCNEWYGMVTISEKLWNGMVHGMHYAKVEWYGTM